MGIRDFTDGKQVVLARDASTKDIVLITHLP
jgi:hypothetical protein